MSTKKPAGNVDIIDEFDFDNYDYVQVSIKFPDEC